VSSSNNQTSICVACQHARSGKLSYNASHHVSTMPLELIHSDVLGPPITSSGGYKYNISFIDDYSPFCWIYLLEHTSDVEKVFYDLKHQNQSCTVGLGWQVP
jgi:hypothetical protein